MRNKNITKAFYIDKLGFEELGDDYDEYLMVNNANQGLKY